MGPPAAGSVPAARPSLVCPSPTRQGGRSFASRWWRRVRPPAPPRGGGRRLPPRPRRARAGGFSLLGGGARSVRARRSARRGARRLVGLLRVDRRPRRVHQPVGAVALVQREQRLERLRRRV